jgi:hypothetical protein
LVADTSQDSVGIGTSYIKEKLHVIGGIGATTLFVGGIGTVHVSTGNTARYENVNITGVGTIATFKANAVDVANINVSAAVTANKFYGDGSTLTGVSVGVRTAGAVLGFGVTFLDRTFVYYDENELGIGTATVWVDAAPFNAGGKYLGSYGATSYGAIGNTAGTKTVPSWYFNNDSNTGIFQGGTADHLSFAAGGSGIATVNVGGLTVSGIVTSHSLSLSGDATVAGNINVTGDLVYNEERAVNSLVSGTSTITNSNATRLNSGISTFTGDVTLTGAAANVTWDKSANSLLFADDAYAKFGAGNDLQIQHSGSHSFISEAGTGSLYLDSSALRVRNYANSHTMAQFIGGGEVELRYNNTQRFVTTGVGASCVGIMSATSFVGDGSALTGIAAGGSGQFNTSITSATAYLLTTSMAVAKTANASSSYRTIVHSIHIANISASEVTVSGEMQSSFSFAHTIPIPAGSAVELLKQPKVLGPGETIELQASAGGSLYATIILEEKEDTDFWDAQVDVTSAATWTDLYTSTSNPSVVQSILLANDDGTNDVKARVIWTDGSNSLQSYLCYDLVVPADSTVELCEQPKYLASGYKLRVYANQADRLEVTASGKQITS